MGQEDFELQGEIQQVMRQAKLTETRGAILCVGINTPLGWVAIPGGIES